MSGDLALCPGQLESVAVISTVRTGIWHQDLRRTLLLFWASDGIGIGGAAMDGAGIGGGGSVGMLAWKIFAGFHSLS